MPYNRNELNQMLDLDQVLSQVANYAQFAAARREIMQAEPLENPLQIQELLQLAREGLEFSRSGKNIRLHDLEDLEKILEQAKRNRVLLPKELFDIQMFLQDCEALKKGIEKDYPHLNDLARSLFDCSRLKRDLDRSLDDQGKIRKDASERLRNLYRQKHALQNEIQNRMRSFLKNHAGDLMDSIATQYNGRMTFLIKASAKNQYGGIVHGSSQSGAAYYIEPGSFVNLNNDLSATQAQIEEEKARICAALSHQAHHDWANLARNMDMVAQIDTAIAKGAWILANDGSVPNIYPGREVIEIEHARHPLIAEEKAVYNSYSLKNPQKILMVSGPNMGGKSVTIKTIALFALLTHAGFPVSAYQAAFPYYEHFYFDLSDLQSIKENLSTFSGHMGRISEILKNADENAFIVLDELGHGTDPTEGAFLAQAVLEDLLKRKATVLVTTHFDQLKTFGKTRDDVLVSSVEFDQQSLQPTYRYLPETSSSSFAFHIARKLDISEEILKRADELKEANQSEMHEQLEKLEILQQETRQLNEQFENRLKHLHQLQRENEEKQKRLAKKQKELDEVYEQELAIRLEEKMDEAKEILSDLRKEGIKQKHTALTKLRELEPEIQEEEVPVERTFKKGDYVKITELNTHGEIVEISKKKAVVLSNGKRISVDFSKIEPMNRPFQPKSTVHKERSFERFPLELNIIGMRVEEGINSLDHYLDQAVVHHVKNVRIIHGMGSGKLRTAVWKDLKKQPFIKSFSAAGPNQGGLGATIVEFK